MEPADVTLRRIARGVGHLLLGTVGTALGAVGVLWLLGPVRVPVYDAFYLAVGPWTSEVTATVLSFAVAGIVGVGLPTLVSVGLRRGTEPLQPLAAGMAAALGVLVIALSLAALAGVIGFLSTIVAFAAFAVGVPIGLRRAGVWPDGGTAFVGGLPVLALLVLLLGFGLGWGGSYDVVATEVPAGDVNGTADATFLDAPQLRDDLLAPSGEDAAGYCEETADGRRTCRLSLRGYEHEAAAARFLDAHGVRCPYRNAPPGQRAPGNQSFVAEDDGTFYRVTCDAYGD